MRKAAWAIPVMALALTACGGHAAAPRSAAAPQGSTRAGSTGVAANVGATAAPAAGTRGSSPAPTSGGAAARGTASPAGATPTPTGPASHREVPLDASLSAPCVTPGGSQTITIHGDPGWRVVFDTRYPDGKDGQVYGGIDYRGSVGSTGSYVYTWAVSLAAPVGDADVEAATVGQDVTGHKRLPFKIALHCS